MSMISGPILIFIGVAFVLTHVKWPNLVLKIAKPLLYFLMFASIAVVLFNAIWYLFTPAYFEFNEENIASTAAYWLHGHEIYHALNSADQYSLLYGPVPVLINACFQSLGFDIFVDSKMPGVLCLIASFFSLSVLVYKNKNWVLPAFLAATLIDYKIITYSNRPDSFIMLFSILALLEVAFDTASTRVAIVLGALGGLLFNCKLHSLIILLPLIAYYIESRRPMHLLRLAGVFSCVCIVTAALPFLLPNVNAKNYLSILQLASSHGLSRDEFLANLTFILPFLIFFFFADFHKNNPLTFYILSASSLMTAIVASKAGAGSHHLLPYLPIYGYFASRCYADEISPAAQKNIRVFAIACFLGVAWLVPQFEVRMFRFHQQTGHEATIELHDLRSLEDKYPGPKAMGTTDTTHFTNFFYTPELVTRGGRFFVDMAALMDFHLAHHELPEATLVALQACAVPEFILPAVGEPFTSQSVYQPRDMVFTDEFRKLFAKKYQRVDVLGRFALYRCQK